MHSKALGDLMTKTFEFTSMFNQFSRSFLFLGVLTGWINCLGCGVTSAITNVGTSHSDIVSQNREMYLQIERKLGENPNALYVLTPGVICPSCSIGIRRNFSSLSFVDTDQPKSGVQIDGKLQLVEVRLKKDAVWAATQVRKAIEDAGYEPELIFAIRDGKMIEEEL